MAGGIIPGPLGINIDLKHSGEGAPGPLGFEVKSPVINQEKLALVAGHAHGASGKSAGSSATAKTDPEIEALDLAPTAKKAAYALKKAHPSVKFTSGRRAKRDQARAMAGNVVSNRKWIEQTYVKSKLRTDLQKWVDDNPDIKTKAKIQAGLLSVLNKASTTALGSFSKHLAGMAFDVQPVKVNANAIKKTIRGLDGLGKFLEKEGGLVRWHVQF